MKKENTKIFDKKKTLKKKVYINIQEEELDANILINKLVNDLLSF